MMFKQLCRLQRYTFLHDLPNVYNTFLHELSLHAYTFLHELSSYCSSSPKWTQKMIVAVPQSGHKK